MKMNGDPLRFKGTRGKQIKVKKVIDLNILLIKLWDLAGTANGNPRK